jgi:hydrogenase nickel incorporation protein HypA/HybF
MHELSVCQAMLDQVAQLVLEHRATHVELIDVEIGELSGVDAALLADAFLIMKMGTCASSAVLNARTVPTCVLCIQCGETTYTRPNQLVCGTCSGYRVSVVEGTELRLRDVKLHIGG